MAYTKQQIIAKIEEAMENPATLYQADVFNYKGSTVDGERYTEIAARELLSRLTQFVIPQISRKNYKADTHADLAKGEQQKNSNRNEEWIAKRLYGKGLDKLGKVLDYQIPLKAVQSDKKTGKIDLLSYNANEQTAYILELKQQDNKDDTLLRCVLEAATYRSIVDEKNLLKSFDLPDDTKLRTAVLIYEDSLPYKDFQQSDSDVRRLMRELHVDFFALSPNAEAVTESHMYDSL